MIVSEALACVESDGSAFVVNGVDGSVSFVSSVVEPKVDLRSAAEDWGCSSSNCELSPRGACCLRIRSVFGEKLLDVVEDPPTDLGKSLMACGEKLVV